jgi:restriction endonuclease
MNIDQMAKNAAKRVNALIARLTTVAKKEMAEEFNIIEERLQAEETADIERFAAVHYQNFVDDLFYHTKTTDIVDK